MSVFFECLAQQFEGGLLAQLVAFDDRIAKHFLIDTARLGGLVQAKRRLQRLYAAL